MPVNDSSCCGECGGSLIEVLVGLGLFVLLLWASVLVLNNFAGVERRVNREVGLLTLKVNSQESLKGQDGTR